MRCTLNNLITCIPEVPLMELLIMGILGLVGAMLLLAFWEMIFRP